MCSKKCFYIVYFLLLSSLTLAGCTTKNAADLNDNNRSEEEEDMEADLLSQGNEIDINLEDIFFGFDSSALKPGITKILDQNVININSNLSALHAVVVEGYCDIRGTEEYNLTLGQKRADSVKSYLVSSGINADKIQAVSRGETEKWATGTSDDSYGLNRRAHFIAIGN